MKLDGSTFEEMFDLSPYLEMVQPIPAPIEVLGKICDIVRFFFFLNKTATTVTAKDLIKEDSCYAMLP